MIAVQSKSTAVGTSVVRTASLPLLVVLVFKFITDATGIDLAGWEGVAGAVLGYFAYSVIRFLEVYSSPKWGYILGVPGAPIYRK